MTAHIGGEQIHAVYGTAALVQHVEQVCRQLLVPHLEPGEEGVGYEIRLTHRAPAPVGAVLVLTATVEGVAPRELVCEVIVRDGTRMVARGSFVQRIVALDEFAAEIAAATG
ncbi:MAG: thioesterase [Actinobacteria bacterium]|nr:thioesterase [Actinomycetota bacterium]